MSQAVAAAVVPRIDGIAPHAVHLCGMLLPHPGCLVGAGQAFSGLQERSRGRGLSTLGLLLDGCLGGVAVLLAAVALLLAR